MKHPHEEINGEEPETSQPRMEEIETKILQELQANLMKGNLNRQIEERLFQTQKNYYAKYIEKTMYEIPMGTEIMKIIQSFKEGENETEFDEFEYMFTAAKSILQSEVRIKQINAIRAVFGMIYNLIGRYIHENVVSPSLNSILSKEQLKMAYEKYQHSAKPDEESAEVKMQSILYYVNEMLESHQAVKVPNPYYSQATQQIKAMCDYIIALLIAVAKPRTEMPDVIITDA